MSSLRSAFVLVLLVLCFIAQAQDQPLLRPSTDAEMWLSGGLELRFDKSLQKKKKKAKDPELSAEQLQKTEERIAKAQRAFKNRIRVSGELGYRGNENLTSSKLFYTVVGLRYRFHKYARLTLEHRYNFRDKYSDNTHRIDVQADSQYELGRVAFGYRLIGQHEFTIPTRYRDIIRNRLQIGYRTKKYPLDPYVAVESFGVLHYTGNQLIGMRYALGAEWDISNDHALDLSIRYDREQNLKALQYRWIFAVAYELKWAR